MKRAAYDRRQKNRALSQQDQARRCAECKRPLSEVPAIIEDFLMDGKFCSDACMEQCKARTEGR